MSEKIKQELLPIPDKLYFTIGETSKLCEIKPHVLRYWEQEFPQLRPSKRRGGRRYYQRKDIELIRDIRELLYIKGFTIAGAKQQIQQQMHKPVVESEKVEKIEVQQEIIVETPPPAVKQVTVIKETGKEKVYKEAIFGVVAGLEELLASLQN